MKLTKLLLVIMAAAIIALALGSNGLAFHEEGVAYCAGCHSMHFSEQGQAPANGVRDSNGYLLKYGDSTNTCLNCHQRYGQFSGGEGYGGGGDFYWITKDFNWVAHNRARASLGEDHGHSLVSPARGWEADVTPGYAPGGNFSSANLSCASCHDPHGKGDAPLLLRNNDPDYFGANFPAAPVMVSAGRSTTPGDDGEARDDNHSAYGSGMSEWCAGCHTTFLGGRLNQMHPAGVANGALGQEIADNYNGYISTDEPDASTATPYWEIVPFETGQALADLEIDFQGPATAGGRVMCLTCHRAHATAFQYATRWDTTTELIAHSHPNGGVPPDADHPEEADNSSAADKINSYYGRTFVESQRSLCNKCHRQDGVHSG